MFNLRIGSGWRGMLVVGAVIGGLVFGPVGAARATGGRLDIAPPEPPPGTNILPGAETTQVRMVSETVVLVVQPSAPAGIPAQAAVTATFTMRNLGTQAESMGVRFPLDYWVINYDDSMPDIDDVRVRVNGSTVGVRTETQPGEVGNSQVNDWAVFDVTFPPGQDVIIEVRYTADAAGFTDPDLSDKSMVFQYILETGAGWNGTIGSADVIVRLPFEAELGLILGEDAGYGLPTPGFSLAGNEIRWHFEELEPGWANNILLPMVRLDAWNAVLAARQAVRANPNDGEAWGRLGMRLKQVLLGRHAMRTGEGAEHLYAEARAAYERSLELLPDDGLWHYGYADLLWQHYETQRMETGTADPEESDLAVRHLQLSLELAPNNERAYDTLCWMYEQPGYLGGCESGCYQCPFEQFVFLALTATPLPPTPWDFTPPSETPLPPSATEVASTTPVSEPTLTPPAATEAAAVEATFTPQTEAGTGATPPRAPEPAGPDQPPDRVCPPVIGAPLAMALGAVWLRRRRVSA